MNDMAEKRSSINGRVRLFNASGAVLKEWWLDLLDRGAVVKQSGPVLPDLWAMLLVGAAGVGQILNTVTPLLLKYLGLGDEILKLLVGFLCVAWCMHVVRSKAEVRDDKHVSLQLYRRLMTYSYRQPIRTTAKVLFFFSLFSVAQVLPAGIASLVPMGKMVYGTLNNNGMGPLRNAKVFVFRDGINITKDSLPTDDNGDYVVELKRSARRTDELVVICPSGEQVRNLYLSSDNQSGFAEVPGRNPLFFHFVSCYSKQ